MRNSHENHIKSDPIMKTYQIKWIGSIYKTIEIKATNEDEAIDLFNSGEGKTISYITKHDDINEIKEVSK